jgi:hypothetical protein
MKEILTEWRKFVNEQEQLEIPPVLYHATYEPLLKSVQDEGLGGLRDTQYEDSVRGVVYLALDPDVAFSYAETSDAAWDKFETDEGLPILRSTAMCRAIKAKRLNTTGLFRHRLSR